MRIEGEESIRLPARSEIEETAREIGLAWSNCSPGTAHRYRIPTLYAMDNLFDDKRALSTERDWPRLIALTVLAGKVVRPDGTVDYAGLGDLNVAAARCGWNAVVCYDLQVPGSCRGGRRKQRTLDDEETSRPYGTITINLFPEGHPPIKLI